MAAVDKLLGRKKLIEDGLKLGGSITLFTFIIRGVPLT